VNIIGSNEGSLVLKAGSMIPFNIFLIAQKRSLKAVAKHLFYLHWKLLVLMQSQSVINLSLLARRKNNQLMEMPS